MSFSFGFNAQDLSDDELEGTLPLESANSSKYSSLSNDANPLDDSRLKDVAISQPQLVDLKSVLETLVDVRISFEQFKTPNGFTDLYRRELFDVKHQLMSEIDETDSQNDEMDILIGDTSEDLRQNVYEGGLKSWECSIDVVESLAANQSLLDDFDCILELGCGTSLPSEHIFKRYLEKNTNKGLKLILSDYNKSVLRLVTIPNFIITWAKTVLSKEEWVQLQQREDDSNIPAKLDELQLSKPLLDTFFQDIESRNVSFTLVSGSWGRSFTDIVGSHIKTNKGLLVVTSETIYQPENLPVVAETIIEVVTKQSRRTKTLVAAKDIYFGVGGSIVEFEKYLNQAIGTRSLSLSFYTYKVDAGLKRSIISIE